MCGTGGQWPCVYVSIDVWCVCVWARVGVGMGGWVGVCVWGCLEFERSHSSAALAPPPPIGQKGKIVFTFLSMQRPFIVKQVNVQQAVFFVYLSMHSL